MLKVLDAPKQKIKPVGAFKSGYPTYSRFTNGWPCSNCKKVTEHREENGFRICNECNIGKPYLLSAIHGKDYNEQQRQLNAFCAALRFSILETEARAIEVCTLEEKGKWKRLHEEFTGHGWLRAKNHFLLNTEIEVHQK